jgi:hypothetical protein
MKVIPETCRPHELRYIRQSGLTRFMVLNAPFNNISVISLQSVVLLEKTTDLSQVTDKLYHIMCIKYTSPWAAFELTTLVAIDTDCTCNCKSNYHTIISTTAPTTSRSLILRHSDLRHATFSCKEWLGIG